MLLCGVENPYVDFRGSPVEQSRGCESLQGPRNVGMEGFTDFPSSRRLLPNTATFLLRFPPGNKALKHYPSVLARFCFPKARGSATVQRAQPHSTGETELHRRLFPPSCLPLTLAWISPSAYSLAADLLFHCQGNTPNSKFHGRV